MTNKIINILIISVGIVFLCWYLPVAFYNVFACDDYWFGTNVRINGFWNNQLFYWHNWEGSYTHTFLASLPHVVQYARMPLIGNMFSLLLFYVSIYLFLKTYTNLTNLRCLSNSLFLIAFLYLCTKGNSEIRFWICANVTYVSEMSFLLFFFSLYHNLNKESSYKKWSLLILLLFLIGGSKLTFILYAVSGMVMHDVLFERIEYKYFIITSLILSVFVILNISAPGNYIRIGEETMPKDEQMTLLGSIFYRIIEMKPFIISTLFLLPIAAHWKPQYSFNEKRVGITLTIFFVTFIIDSIIMYLCFNDSGPLRVYFVAEVCISIIVLFILNHLYTSVLYKYKFESSLLILLIIMILASDVPMILQVPDSIEYSKKARERDEYVASCVDDEIIKITPLPDSHLMLSYFSNDEIWLERIYLPYFQKRNKFILMESFK